MIVLVMVVQELWINEYILCIGLLLLIGIPLVSMIYCGLKLILKIKNKNKALRITSFSLWIIGLIIVATSGIDIAKRFTYQKTTFDTVFLQPTKSPKIIITSSDNNKINGATKSYIGWSSEEEEENFGINISGFLWKEDTIRMRPFLKIVRSTDDSLMSLVVKKYARGESAKQALSLTEKISYQFTQKDSLIDFSSYSQTLKSDSWRFQHVKLILQIPVGKTIFIDRSMKHIIYDVENVKNIADSDMLDKNWMMTEKGLVCIDCTGNESIVDEED